MSRFQGHEVIIDIITIGIPAVIMIVSYIMIWWFIWTNGKYLKQFGHEDLRKVISKREIQATRTLFLVCLCYLLFVVPISLLDTLNLLDQYQVFLILRSLYYLQYSLNVFIYAVKSEQYRQAYVYFLQSNFPFLFTKVNNRQGLRNRPERLDRGLASISKSIK